MTKRSFRDVLVQNITPSSHASTATSTFRSAVDADLQTANAMQLGQNGCLEYTNAGVGSDILAISQMVRGAKPAHLVNAILARGSTTEIVQLVELMFATRNTRGGKGEKKLAFDMFLTFSTHYPSTAQKLLPLFPHYGYWKDLLLLMASASLVSSGGDDLISASLHIIQDQWLLDLAALKDYKLRLQQATGNPQQMQNIRKQGPNISLLAKWLPRERSALDKRTRFVDRFTNLIYPVDTATVSNVQRVDDEHHELHELDELDGLDGSAWKSSAKSKYRKQVAELTSFLELPEVLLAAKRDDEIKFERVASKATKRLTKTFLNETSYGQPRSTDPKRIKLRDLFLDRIVKKGLKGGQLMPHEIVATILQNDGYITTGMELALDAQWKSLWKSVVDQVKAKADQEGLDFNPTQMVPICDVSGSMYGTPMEVAIALGIGISEITHDAFKHMVLTFSADPTWHRLKPTDTIVQKVRNLRSAPWGMNTDFCKAYDLMLQVCVDHKLHRADMPSLIVFSDMQFDDACVPDQCSRSNGGSSPHRTMFDMITSKVQKVASQLNWDDANPSPIIFWNLRNTGGHPVDKDTEGTVLLSGFSPSLLKLVMNGEALKETEVEVVQNDGTTKVEKIRVTPEEIVKKMLDDTVYDPVRKILGESREGALREYEYLVRSVEDDGFDDEYEVISMES